MDVRVGADAVLQDSAMKSEKTKTLGAFVLLVCFLLNRF